jgi:hypothetical protein
VFFFSERGGEEEKKLGASGEKARARKQRGKTSWMRANSSSCLVCGRAGGGGFSARVWWESERRLLSPTPH